jgi:hypothetical protein
MKKAQYLHIQESIDLLANCPYFEKRDVMGCNEADIN